MFLNWFFSWVESVGETDEDKLRSFDESPVANVPAIVRPIFTGRTIIRGFFINLRAIARNDLEVFPLWQTREGGRLICLVFHTGERIGRGNGNVKEYFQLKRK